MAKREEIYWRRQRIVQLLKNRPGGRATYGDLAGELCVSQRTVYNDCKSLAAVGQVVCERGGVRLASSGGESYWGEKLGKKHLRRMAILRLLFNRERSRLEENRGLTAQKITEILAGQGSNLSHPSLDTVIGDLKEMEEQGLVTRKGDLWYTGTSVIRPVLVDRELAVELCEYLLLMTGLIPLTPELAALRYKLHPALMVPDRENWKEDLVKMMDRVVVHGYLPGNDAAVAATVRKLEEAVADCRVIEVVYRKNRYRLYPRGLVYQWGRDCWYLLATGGACSRSVVQLYRVDRMREVEVTAETFEDRDFKVSDFLGKRWGISGDACVQVTVRFRNTEWDNTAVERVCGELARRQRLCHTCQLTEEPDGSVILRDTVAGISEFSAWLRRYGDAAEVLEPEFLRKRFYKTASQILARYGKEGCRE